MKKFEDQLSRMQSLMTYGMVSESTNKKGSFEYHRLASDGKSYGIFKECSKYYIKSAPAEKENLAEAYDYIGGWNNRKDYEYDSFANAQKQFDLKMMSINEACGAKANAATLNPSKKQEYIVEGTENMRKEIARQRQIMANTMTIIREGSYIGVGDPERVSGNNDEDKPYTEKGEAKLDKDMPKANCKPAAESNPYGDGKAPEKGKDVKSSDVLSNGTAVAAEHPSGGKVTRVDEECSGCVNNSAPNGARDWGSEGIGKGNGDPKENGWEMDDAQYVNEEINDAKEWDEGLPGSAGTGEADTDHNNDPYKENVNEGEEGEDEYDVEGGEEEEVPSDIENDEVPAEDELGGEEVPAEDELGGEEELPVEDELGDEDLEGEDDLEAEIAELRAEIEALKAEIEGGEEAPVDDELGGEEAPVEDELSGDEAPVDDELGGEEVPAEGELGGEEEIPLDDDEDNIEALQEAKRAYMESVVNKAVKSLLEAKDSEWKNRFDALFGGNPFNEKEMDKKFGKGAAKKAYGDTGRGSKKDQQECMNEDKTVLHDFGNHPGYRKKPMDLPPTGSDNVDGKKDWNDDSVHSEEPFGKTIGDGKPYEKRAQLITDRVMEQIKKKA